MPLHVVILGGEISRFAQDYAREIFNSLKSEFESQAITVEFELMDWDVCDKFSNTDLIRRLTLQSHNCLAKLLVLANFSGFLEKEKKWNDAKNQFDELFRYSQGDNSIILWIEPRMNTVTNDGGFFSRLTKWVKLFLKKIIKEIEIQHDSYAQSSVKVKHPLKEETFNTNLAVVKFELTSGR
jgi:hypothetical protein